MTDELTRQEKARLLGNNDWRNQGDYDHEFYETMCQVRTISLDEVDDRVRRAILRFIRDGSGQASHNENGGFVMMGFVHGYLVGQKLQMDIRRPPSSKSQDDQDARPGNQPL